MLSKVNDFLWFLKSKFSGIIKITLISVYIIFLAGAVVRMTGSGMGCPDWPKCFGYLIPPTSEKQIIWKPNKEFKEGMIILKDETLFVARQNIITSEKFNQKKWKKYTTHDYTKFNKYHTWAEYINRLTSVVSGFIFIFLILGSIKFRKEKKLITVLSFLAFFLMGSEAWLGKTVVDTNLKPAIITIHMMVGLIIIGLLLYILHTVSEKTFDPARNGLLKYNSTFNKLLIVSVVFSLIQIATGTQVRQFIDEQVKQFGFEHKQYSLLNPDFRFYFHRSFTITIILVNFGLFYINQIRRLQYKLIHWIIFLIFLETITGILMYYAEFPIGTQAVHLLGGAILFGLQFYLWLQSRRLISLV